MNIEEAATYAHTVGITLRTVREERRLSQASLAVAAGMTQSNVSRIEQGLALPDAYQLRCLASALHLDVVHFAAVIEQGWVTSRTDRKH